MFRRIAQMQIRGQSFLYKMVRHIVGAVVSVGKGELDAGSITKLLQDGLPEAQRSGDHRGWTVAEARGLHKVHVEYPPWTSADERLYEEDGVTLRRLPHEQANSSVNTLDTG